MSYENRKYNKTYSLYDKIKNKNIFGRQNPRTRDDENMFQTSADCRLRY